MYKTFTVDGFAPTSATHFRNATLFSSHLENTVLVPGLSTGVFSCTALSNGRIPDCQKYSIIDTSELLIWVHPQLIEKLGESIIGTSESLLRVPPKMMQLGGSVDVQF